ncbi:hypothetical protein [Deinococcus aetherius]|uniref:hypothetical protein n=1 Tax=Deinococcus aetherius TaxID=200252 RepID=UPI0022309690|nr:hypothetical protein [Deinococcus aetherius]
MLTRAWTLAEELDDAAARVRLHELQSQWPSLPDGRRAQVLEEVTTLGRQLGYRQATDPRR